MVIGPGFSASSRRVTGCYLDPLRIATLGATTLNARAFCVTWRAMVRRSIGRLAPRGSARSKTAAWLLLGGVFAGAAIYFVYLGQHTTFYRDDWYFILYRDGTSIENVLASHADQQVPGMVSIFVALYKLVGLSDYFVYRLLAIPVYLGCSAIVYYIANRRMGHWGALGPAVLVLLPGASYVVALWPFVTLAFAAPGLLGLAAFLSMEQRSFRGDIVAATLLLLAVTFSGYALPFATGAAAGVVLGSDRNVRRLWVPFAPGFAYILWSHIYGDRDIDLLFTIREVPEYMTKMAVSSIVGVTGLNWTASSILAVALAVFSAYRLFKLRGNSQMAISITAAVLSFWALTAMARSGTEDPGAIRYIFPSVLLMAPLLASISLEDRFKNAFSIGFAVLAIMVIPHGIREFNLGSNHLQIASAKTRAQLAALELGRESIDPTLYVRLASCPGCTLMAGNLFGALDRYESSPAYSLDELLDESESVRESADRSLANAQAILASPPSSTRETHVRSVQTDDCRILKPGQPILIRNLQSSPATLGGPSRSIRVSLRRFADRFQTTPIPAGSTKDLFLAAPDDPLGQPAWQARLEATGNAVQVCTGTEKSRSSR